ncbi:hypothetical protein [Anditalea andensis]|nr:hypothetical protein [Anditalea andensis]
MKSKRIISLLALMIYVSSCDLLSFNTPPESVGYNLYLSFQDVSGNDLVKGIELNGSSGAVKDSLYILDIIISEPCQNWDNTIYNAPARPGFIPDVNLPQLGMVSYNGYSHLTNHFGLSLKNCGEQKKLTYKLKCPYLFGDDAIHEFITYWEIPKDKLNHGAKCYRIEFEGNEITPTPMVNYENTTFTAAIILE